MSVKLKPHHDLSAIQAKFASVETLEITGKATRDARDLGYTLKDIVGVVQALESRDFVKSETAIVRPIRRFGTTPTKSHTTTCSCT